MKISCGGYGGDKIQHLLWRIRFGELDNFKTKLIMLMIGTNNFADIETGRPAAKDDLFWIASNAKGVAAPLVLTFVDEGKIVLDDPVEKYFPAWKDIRVGKERTVPKTKPTVRMERISRRTGRTERAA